MHFVSVCVRSCQGTIICQHSFSQDLNIGEKPIALLTFSPKQGWISHHLNQDTTYREQNKAASGESR